MMRLDWTRALLAKHGLWIAALAVVAFVTVLVATQNGLNLNWDSGNYISYAHSIRAGDGLSIRVSANNTNRLVNWYENWPPLYPMVLALGSDVFAWARLLDAITFAIAVVLTYAIAYRVIGQVWAAGMAAIVYLTIPTVVREVYATPLSETIFTVFCLAIVLLMLNYRFGEEPKSMRPALYAAGLSALAMLTRYLGMTVAAGMIAYSVLWALSVRSRQRWLPAVMFALSFIPAFLYSLYLYAMTGSLTGGQPSHDPIKLSHIPETLRLMTLELAHALSFLGNLVGVRTNWWIIGVVILLVAVLGRLTWRHRAAVRRVFRSEDGLLVVYIAVYLVGFWILALPSTRIVADWRHFVPIYPAVLALVFHLLAVLPVDRRIVGAVVALYCVSGVAALQVTIQGEDWNSEAWRTDPIVARLAELIPPDALVHSNEVAYIGAHLGAEITLRTFGGSFGFQEYQCSDLVYPPGFSTAVFTLFDSDLLRGMTPDDARAYFTDWASPCGTVERIDNDSFAMIMSIHLNGR